MKYVDENREAVISCIGQGGITSSRSEEEPVVSVGEVCQAVGKIKGGKAAGIDGIKIKMLKVGGDIVLEWLVLLFNKCMEEGKVPRDWQRACIVPLYKGKGDKRECKNYRGISLLSKMKNRIADEQGGFRKGRGCVDQVFTVKHISEQYLDKAKEVFVAFMDLEKVYDRVDRGAMWQMLQMYGIGGRLLKAVKSFYEDSEAQVRVCRKEGDYFPVKVGLRQGCVMPPWLFNICVFIDGVVREVNVRVLARGVELKDKESHINWELSQLLFADDTGLLGDSEEKLQRLVDEFGRVCKRRKLKVNTGKSKVMRITKRLGDERLDIRLEGESMEEVYVFRYLGVDVSADGSMKDEVNHRIDEGKRVSGALRSLWRQRTLFLEAKRGMYESIVLPTLLYGCEAWVVNVAARRRLEAVEMSCLRAMCGVNIMQRIRSLEVRRRCGIAKTVVQRAEEGLLMWFGHVERMERNGMTSRVYQSVVEGRRGRGQPRKGWREGVKKVLCARGLDFLISTTHFSPYIKITNTLR
ncbi:RNA-directed DNA polymerase from mobile element jockey isoform X1 [Cherax quadricarinatus]|uniref:RNA-directed DNA polymerase from mobile element jockey isoform X1 n=1 Tax=Cherax quadricarinatus TaxID=27406 RepID=UPI00387ED158